MIEIEEIVCLEIVIPTNGRPAVLMLTPWSHRCMDRPRLSQTLCFPVLGRCQGRSHRRMATPICQFHLFFPAFAKGDNRSDPSAKHRKSSEIKLGQTGWSIPLSIQVCSTTRSIDRSIDRSFHPSIHRSIYPTIYLSMCRTICPSVH